MAAFKKFFYIILLTFLYFFYPFLASFLNILFDTLFLHRPSDSTLSEDAGIEPRTVETLALTVRHSDLSARSHPHSARSYLFLSGSKKTFLVLKIDKLAYYFRICWLNPGKNQVHKLYKRLAIFPSPAGMSLTKYPWLE